IVERLTIDGYFHYHEELDEYSLTRKAIFYVLANANRVDLDNFTLRSVLPSNDDLATAPRSLKDRWLTIRVVERHVISDSVNIPARPSDRIIVMGKNRDSTMNGQLQSSNFQFTRRSIRFNYDEFFINMTDMDSITYVPREKCARGEGGEVVGSIRYDKAGTFYLADAKNKSGQQ